LGNDIFPFCGKGELVGELSRFVVKERDILGRQEKAVGGFVCGCVYYGFDYGVRALSLVSQAPEEQDYRNVSVEVKAMPWFIRCL